MEQSNALEAALVRATEDTEHRAAFYQTLLASEVYVIGQVNDEAAPPVTGTPADASAPPLSDKLSLQHWKTRDGRPVIPFFTGLGTLRRVMQQDDGYLALPTRELFELTRGAALILNPLAQPSMDFYPEDVQALLDAAAQQDAQTGAAAQPDSAASAADRIAGQTANASQGGLVARLRGWLGMGPR